MRLGRKATQSPNLNAGAVITQAMSNRTNAEKLSMWAIIFMSCSMFISTSP